MQSIDVDLPLLRTYNVSVNDFFSDIRAILFDMDGTLVETKIDFAHMKREMLALASKHGIPEREAAELDILGIVDLILSKQEDAEEARQIREYAFRKLEEIELENIEEAREVPGASEVVSVLREKGIKIAIVTRNSRRVGYLSLEKTGIVPDLFLSRDDVRNAKPHPDHVQAALISFGVEPSQAIMVGDHWMDIQAGKAAGTKTIGFLRVDRPEDFFERYSPDLIIRDLRELLQHFRRSHG